MHWLKLQSGLAIAHGVQGRADLPVPISVFTWGAGLVVAVSFLGLLLLWRRPLNLARCAREVVSDTHSSWPVVLSVMIGRSISLAGLVVVLTTTLAGSRDATDNIAPTLIWVAWWVGMVPLSLLAGPVVASCNPWDTLAQFLRIPATHPGRTWPRWLGHWPAVVVLGVLVWVELASPWAGSITVLGILAVVYTAISLTVMALVGRQSWIDYGEIFAVWSTMVARLSPWQVTRSHHDPRSLSIRLPFSGAAAAPVVPGLGALMCLLIGSVGYDGLSRSGVWVRGATDASIRLADAGLPVDLVLVVVPTLGLLGCVTVTLAIWYAASGVADRIAGTRDGASQLAHALIPVAVAYSIAHYFSFLVFQSQDLIRLADDPAGWDWSLLGTAAHEIDFSIVSSNTIWLVQVVAIIVGHVAGLALAHERVLVNTSLSNRTSSARFATLSQVPVVIAMVSFTISGLWLLSEGMS